MNGSGGKRDAPRIGGIALSAIAQCTCRRLRRTARRASELYDACLAPAGLTGAQFSLLVHIRAADLAARRLTIGALAVEADLDATTLSRNLRPLIAAGLVQAAKDPADRRARRLALTAAGAATLDQAAPLWAEAQSQLNATLGQETAQRLADALAQALESLAPPPPHSVS